MGRLRPSARGRHDQTHTFDTHASNQGRRTLSPDAIRQSVHGKKRERTVRDPKGGEKKAGVAEREKRREGMKQKHPPAPNGAGGLVQAKEADL
jgi:hypothetical protein